MPEPALSNAELASGLLRPAFRDNPQTIRIGAAMSSAPGNPPEELAWLAKLERTERVVCELLRTASKAGQG